LMACTRNRPSSMNHDTINCAINPPFTREREHPRQGASATLSYFFAVASTSHTSRSVSKTAPGHSWGTGRDHTVTATASQYTSYKLQRCSQVQKPVAGTPRNWLIYPMPRTRARRYSIEIKNPDGSLLFSTIAYWDDKERRSALAQITRLAGLPDVNFHTEPALEPQSSKSARATARSRSKTARPAPR